VRGRARWRPAPQRLRKSNPATMVEMTIGTGHRQTCRDSSRTAFSGTCVGSERTGRRRERRTRTQTAAYLFDCARRGWVAAPPKGRPIRGHAYHRAEIMGGAARGEPHRPGTEQGIQPLEQMSLEEKTRNSLVSSSLSVPPSIRALATSLHWNSPSPWSPPFPGSPVGRLGVSRAPGRALAVVGRPRARLLHAAGLLAEVSNAPVLLMPAPE